MRFDTHQRPAESILALRGHDSAAPLATQIHGGGLIQIGTLTIAARTIFRPAVAVKYHVRRARHFRSRPWML